MNISEKRIIPIGLTPKDTRKAVEEYILKNTEKEIVFPVEYDIKMTDDSGDILHDHLQYPAISITLEIVEPREQGKRGPDKKPRKSNRKSKATVLDLEPGDAKHLPLTADEAQCILVRMNCDWGMLPTGFEFASYEAKVDAIAKGEGRDWRLYDDRE